MSKPTLLAIALAAAIPAATLPATSLAAPSGQEAAVLSLNIPAGSLNQVLVRLAQAGGVTLSVNSSAVAGQSSAGIKGSYTLDEAFAQVLNGTGLQATQTTQGYVLEQAESQEAAIAPEKALTLDKVVVTASGFEQELVDAPASISVITREDIESRYYSDVTDALRNIPGVTITGGGSGDGGTDISMRGLPSSYTLLLVDGKFPLPAKLLPQNVCQVPLIKGDAKYGLIALASILAKTHRDRYMIRAGDTYPGYGFERHKGYPTKAHKKAIGELGLCPLHRRTFKGADHEPETQKRNGL